MEITQCKICQKTLGQESRDLEYWVCHSHRSCTDCVSGSDDPEILLVSPAEVRWCIENNSPIKHARCLKLSDKDTLPIALEIMNLRRLLVQSCIRISELSFDQAYQYLDVLETTAAFVSTHVNKNKKELNARLDQDRLEREKAQAKQEAQTSSRPVTKSASSTDEKAIGQFMQTYQITERKTAIKEMKYRENAIEKLMKYGMPQEKAEKTADEQIALNHEQFHLLDPNHPKYKAPKSN